MNDHIHSIFEQTLRPFAPEPSLEDRLAAMTIRGKEAESELASLIRSALPDRSNRRVVRIVTAASMPTLMPRTSFIQAIDALIDKHIDELESDVKSLMEQREDEL